MHGHLHRVLEMDVIVRRTVNDQQTRAVVAEQVREIDGRIVVVSLRIVVGKTIEIFPYRSNRSSATK